MIFRYLQIRPGTPAEELPSAAVVDLLERGDLEEWRPVAVAIARDPFGDLAERVLDLVDAFPMYGTSPLWRSWIHGRRTRLEGARHPASASDLSTLRRERGLTQKDLSERMGMSQSDLSKLERRRDVRLSSLRSYARAVGATLRILVEHDGRLTELLLPKPDP